MGATSFIVVPAKAGTQGDSIGTSLDSRLRGNDDWGRR
jgi:hypothetical protein